MPKPLILAIDDDQFYLNEIQLELAGKAELRGFKGPYEFDDQVTETDLKTASLILVDFDFGHTTAVDLELASYIRSLGYKRPIVLWSLLDSFGEYTEKIESAYDDVLVKSEFSWAAMLSRPWSDNLGLRG